MKDFRVIDGGASDATPRKPKRPRKPREPRVDQLAEVRGGLESLMEQRAKISKEIEHLSYCIAFLLTNRRS